LASTNDPHHRELQSAAYTLSRARIFEQVIINMLSALALGALAAVTSLLLLLYQHVAQAIIVPTNVLLAIMFFGLGALVMLVILGIVVYVAIRRSTAVSIAVFLGLLGYAIATNGIPDSLRDAVKAGADAVARKAATRGASESESMPHG
jgi:hypothetical protein